MGSGSLQCNGDGTWSGAFPQCIEGISVYLCIFECACGTCIIVCAYMYVYVYAHLYMFMVLSGIHMHVLKSSVVVHVHACVY